jgi:hypothetical protein
MWFPFLNWFVEIIALRSLGGCSGGVDSLDRLVGLGDRLGPGEADDAFAVGFEDGLLLGVVFAGEAVVVPFGSVGFDDQPFAWPSEVGDDGAAVDVDRSVDVWWGEARTEEEVEDGVFEFASGRGVAGGEDLGEVGVAGAGAQAVQGLEDLGDRGEVALGFADRAS